MSDKIKILIADDHPIVRDGIKLMLEYQDAIDTELYEAKDGLEVLELAENNTYDVFLLDINMPNMDGITALQELIKRNSKCRVIIFTMHNDSHHISKAINAGALGYVLKQSNMKVLVEAINAVMRYEPYYSEEVKHIVNRSEA